MRFVPIVVIIPEDVLPLLNVRADAASELLNGWLDLKTRNGWTNEAIVAGSILAASLRFVNEQAS